MKICTKVILGLLALLLSFNILAQKIYTWQDEFGTTHFTSTPPPGQSVEEAELGKEAASGLGGTPSDPNLFLDNNNTTPNVSSGSSLRYSEKQEIQRLENRSQRQDIPNSLKRFYAREIDRIEEGRTRFLSDEKKALREKHLNFLIREFNKEEEIAGSIKIIDGLYKKSR